MFRRTLPNWAEAAAGARSWTSTIRLPKSTLPLRTPLPSPYIKAATDELYQWQTRARSKPRPDSILNGNPKPDESESKSNTFILHDGPPYANGPLHLGHALNKIGKDMICRIALGQGKRVEYVPGWDCHGLPIEIKALEASGGTATRPEVRNLARRFALETVEKQMAGFREWAVMADWDRPYKTLDREYELRQLAVFGQMVEQGLIYRARKPVYWSGSSGTALAEGELEYDENFVSTAAYVGFPVAIGGDGDGSGLAKWIPEVKIDKLSFLVWTTTPWTLPANRAIGIGPTIDYCVVQAPDGCQFFVSADRVDAVQKAIGMDVTVLSGRISGGDLASTGVRFVNPLRGSMSQPLITAGFVTDDTGTGVVHLAPGHGFDDYTVCTDSAESIEIAAPVDDRGRFTADALPADPDVLAEKDVLSDGSAAVVEYIRAGRAGGMAVLATHQITHKYPTDWRTRKPVVIRATAQWFVDAARLGPACAAALEDVHFWPRSGRNRLNAFLGGRSQWCISRQRPWGVPIPALYRIDDDGAEHVVLTPSSIEHVSAVIRERGIDAWWTDAPDDPAWVPDELEKGRYVRGTDTMDVWFDSGTSWTLLGGRRADVYFEGSDQHRGWFQSSLVTAVASQLSKALPTSSSSSSQTPTPHAPFRTLLTHGFTLDAAGRKMSKSIGNTIEPGQLMDGSMLTDPRRRGSKGGVQQSKSSKSAKSDPLGPDLLRLWVASSDYTRDIVVSDQVIQTAAATLKKFRGTFKWLLGVLDGYKPRSMVDADGIVQFADLPAGSRFTLADEMALHHLAVVAAGVHAHYSAFEFFRAVHAIGSYVATDLSAFYAEAAKDRLYTGQESDRLAAQEVCWRILCQLSEMLAPVLPLLVAEVDAHLPAGLRDAVGEMGAMRRVWRPYVCVEADEGSLADRWVVVKSVHAAVRQAVEQARNEKLVGSSLECDVVVEVDKSQDDGTGLVGPAAFLAQRGMGDELAALMVVSDVRVEVRERVTTGETTTATQSEQTVPFEISSGSSGVVSGRVWVTKAQRHKCPRCWRRVADVEGHLCGRCAIVVG